MTQCPIDYIFVEIKMTLRSAKFWKLEPPDVLKLCFERQKLILFSEYLN